MMMGRLEKSRFLEDENQVTSRVKAVENGEAAALQGFSTGAAMNQYRIDSGEGRVQSGSLIPHECVL